MSNYVPEAFNHNQRGTEVSTYTDLYGGLSLEERTSERNMNVTLHRALLVCVLAGSPALALALAAGAGSAEAKSLVVGPGESIQKAINAAHPYDTILVKGVHREDVVISKDGIKLRGDDAVIEPPAKADSPCAPEAICILGDMNFQTGEITGPRVSDVSVSGFTIRDIQDRGQPAFSIDVLHARNATVAGNRVIDITGGIGITSSSINTTIAKNHVIGNPNSSASGIRVEYSSLTTIAKNVVRNIPEGENAIDVAEGSVDTTIAENDLEDDWVGPFVVDSPGTKILSNDVSRFGIVGTFVAGQKSANTQVVGNHISGNVPSGPTRISGGVVVATDPYFGGTIKPNNDSVIGNRFGRNKPDIYWDGSGTGNVFRASYCDTSVPKRLCD